MTIGKAIRDLGLVVDDLESGTADVVTVDIDDSESDAGAAISATVGLTFDLLEDLTDRGVELTPHDVRLEADGSLSVDLSVRAPGVTGSDSDGSTVATTRTDTTADESPGSVSDTDDGSESRSSVETGEGASSDSASGTTGGGDSPGDGEVSPHRDPDRLRAVYDQSKTFAEMTEALDVDVTPQTVRRNMIEHGIHDPVQTRDADDESSGQDESEGEADDAKTALADGIDLPQGTSLEDIKEAVRTGRTLYDVQTRLDVDRSRARRILRELGLLELVAGRLQEADRDVSEDEIDERIQGATPTGT